ncbi:MAG: malate dehydrogenase [Candidatus Altiarchaeales archaeon HGW-Altiarchaeales-1]|nr:MAG: malate dehydrogenase [Candidatus Altiarchaeales archaeon HGW-Altiarchaeales-1]
MSKISVIGAGGRVGSSCVRNIAEILGKNGNENTKNTIAMIDIPQALNLMKGMAIDIKDAVMNDVEIFVSDNRADIIESDIIVITAGKPRGPGMTREQLLSENAAIIKVIAEDIAKFSPDSKVIVVSNPLDIMSYVAYTTMHKISNKTSKEIMGMGGVLDSMRYRKFIAEVFNCGLKDVSGAIVLGIHGEGMVPIESTVRLKRSKIKEEDKEKLDEAVKKTTSAGKTIADFGASAYFAPGVAVAKMVNAIIKDTKEILPCSVFANGNYGINDDLFVGLPVRIGKDGVEEIADLKISDEEKVKIKSAAEILKDNLTQIK